MANPNQVSLVTPRGISQYPRLGKPDTKYVAEGEYNNKLRFDTNDESVQAFIEKVTALHEGTLEWGKAQLEEQLEKVKDAAKRGALKKKIASISLADSPIKPVLDEEGEETDQVVCNFKCKAQFTSKKDDKVIKVTVAIRDAKRNPVDPLKVQIGGGTESKNAVVAYPYYNAKDNVTGITFRLQAVQILKLVEYGKGGGDFGFGDEEGDEIKAQADTDSDGFADESDDSTDNDDF